MNLLPRQGADSSARGGGAKVTRTPSHHVAPRGGDRARAVTFTPGGGGRGGEEGGYGHGIDERARRQNMRLSGQWRRSRDVKNTRVSGSARSARNFALGHKRETCKTPPPVPGLPVLPILSPGSPCFYQESIPWDGLGVEFEAIYMSKICLASISTPLTAPAARVHTPSGTPPPPTPHPRVTECRGGAPPRGAHP